MGIVANLTWDNKSKIKIMLIDDENYTFCHLVLQKGVF